MRIIAGALRGRRIRTPTGSRTRPMLDRVREAMFSTLGPWLADARVLDLFAGTGSLGLEALSRGARSARLVERDRDAVRSLRESIEEFDLGERALVANADALDSTSWDEVVGVESTYDIVFMDPPYPMLDQPPTRRLLFAALRELVASRLAEDGVLVYHAQRGRLQAEDMDEIGPNRVREYGSNALWYLQRAGEGSE